MCADWFKNIRADEECRRSDPPCFPGKKAIRLLVEAQRNLQFVACRSRPQFDAAHVGTNTIGRDRSKLLAFGPIAPEERPRGDPALLPPDGKSVDRRALPVMVLLPVEWPRAAVTFSRRLRSRVVRIGVEFHEGIKLRFGLSLKNSLRVHVGCRCRRTGIQVIVVSSSFFRQASICRLVDFQRRTGNEYQSDQH